MSPTSPLINPTEPTPPISNTLVDPRTQPSLPSAPPRRSSRNVTIPLNRPLVFLPYVCGSGEMRGSLSPRIRAMIRLLSSRLKPMIVLLHICLYGVL
ncbi:hypothetical protein V2J09_005829 [Rumex salicifolius]